MENKKPKNTKWVKWLIFLIVAAAVAIVIWFLFRGEETYISDDIGGTKTAAFSCKAGEAEEMFFAMSGASGVTQEIKGTFHDESLEKISYSASGVYGSKNAAESAEAALHGEYNKFMSAHSLSAQSLSPTFSVMEEKVKISLYAERSKLNATTAELFFLSAEDFQHLKTFSLEDYVKIYQEKGFKCEIYN